MRPRRRKRPKTDIGRSVFVSSRCTVSVTNHSVQLHVQGKTDKAKSDLARLAKIRAEREVAAARRKQEAEGQCLSIYSYHSNFSLSLQRELSTLR